MLVEEAYKNLELIVTQGFICIGIKIEDNYIVLKTITDREHKNIKYYTPDDNENLYLLYRLCFSTFMIDGENYLVDRNRKFTQLKNFYKKLPNVFVTEIIKYVSELQHIYLKSLEYFEGFCYTDRSRYLWRVLNKENPIGKNFYGIEGVESLGLNSVQENWIIVNNHLDQEVEYETQFNLSIMVASSQNPKGAKSIAKNYEYKKNEQKQLREEIAKYGFDKKRVEEQRKENKWAVPIKSNADLVRELNREMRGEKDQHDLFIEKWIKMQREKAEEAKNRISAREEQYQKKMREVDLDQEASKPISAEEMRQIIELNKMKKPKGTTKSIENYHKSEDQERYFKKISSRVIKSNKQE